MAAQLQEDLRGDEDQAGADRISDAKTNQAKSDADTAAYTGGDDQAENGAAGASGSASKGKTDALGSGSKLGGGASGVGGALLNASKAAGSFVGGNKKKIGIGGGVAGLLVSAVLGFMSLLPLKIESMMKNIYGDHMGKVEHMVERRATKIFIRYAMSNSLSATGPIVATGNPLSDLYRTWRTQSFEADLKSKYGYSIERSPVKGKAIRITYAGGTLDAANEAEMTKLLSQDLSRNQARSALKEAIKGETKAYQVLKRWHMRKWMYNAYGIRRWKFFDRKSGKEAGTNLDTNLKESAMGEYKNRLTKALGCIMGEAAQCPDKQGDAAKTTKPSPDAATNAKELEVATSDVAAKETAEGVTKGVSGVLIKGLTKALPIIGWVDLAARIDDFIWNGRASVIVADIRKLQYATTFANWLSISDEIKDGKSVSGDEVNASMLKLEGSEKSATSQRIYSGGNGTGVAPSPDKLFGNEYLQAITDTYKGNPENWGTHYALTAWLHSVSWVLDKIGGVIGWIISFIPGVSTIEQFIGDVLMKGVEWMLTPVVTGNDTGAYLVNAIDVGGEVTANDFSQSVGGQVLTTAQINERTIAMAQDNYAQDSRMSVMDRITSLDNPRTVASRIVAVMPSSLGDAARQSVSGTLAAIVSPFHSFGILFRLSFANILNPAYAAGTVPTYGLEQYGFSEAQLNGDLDEAAYNAAAARAVIRNPAVADAKGNINVSLMLPEDCDPDPANPVVPNICKLDLTAMQALKANFTTEDDANIQGTVVPSTPAAGGTGPTVPTNGNIQQLALKMLSMSSITYWTNNGVNTRDLVVALSQGKPAYTTCPAAIVLAPPNLNPDILNFIIEAGTKTHVMVNAITDKCHSSLSSAHYAGHAVDLDLNSGPLSILNPIAAKYGASKNPETTHHHYDFPAVTP